MILQLLKMTLPLCCQYWSLLLTVGKCHLDLFSNGCVALNGVGRLTGRQIALFEAAGDASA